MTATHTQQNQKDNSTANFESIRETDTQQQLTNISPIKNFHAPSTLLPSRIVAHDAKAGLNPIVDAAGYLFSILGQLKQTNTNRLLSKLQNELIQEINTFQEAIKTLGYNLEFIIVCRYIMCALFDDIISDTSWGCGGQWEAYSLLAAFNQDARHQDKFYTIMERAVKEPVQYIDLMELMYICLSMGYKGQYRATEHNQFQLEQITNNLYKHIRAYRGNFSKTLSPATSFKTIKRPTKKYAAQKNSSLLFTFFVTACIIMVIFISLGYLMDVISNEAYQNLSQIAESVANQT